MTHTPSTSWDDAFAKSRFGEHVGTNADLLAYPGSGLSAEFERSDWSIAPDRSRVVFGEDEYRVFFMCGFGRSGTNWLGKVLNRHPDVYITGEWNFHIFWHAHDEFSGVDYYMGHNTPYNAVARFGLEEMVRRTLLQTGREKPSARFLGDRSSRWLIVLLPGAPHLYLIRDGRDVAVSFTYHHLRVAIPSRHPEKVRATLSAAVEQFRAGPSNAKDAVCQLLHDREWVSYVAGDWAAQVRFAHETKARYEISRANTPILWVRFEDLHADVETERTRIYRFLGVDPDRAERLLASEDETAGLGRDDPYNFYRKGVVGDWTNHASREFVSHFKAVAGRELELVGYERAENW